MTIVVTEKPPMRQHVLATTPSGRVHRWGEDEPNADHVLQNLDDEDTVPGGYKQAVGSLPRKPGVDYSDMAVGTKLEIRGPGQRQDGEYRLERAPRNSGDYLTMDPAAFGYQGHMADNNSAAEIFLDGDLAGFTDPSLARRKILVEGERKLVASVSAGFHDSTSRAAGLVFEFNANALAAGKATGESWYYAGDVDIGAVLFDYEQLSAWAAPDPEWRNRAYLFGDDTGSPILDQSANFQHLTTKGASVTASGPGRRYAMLENIREAALAGEWLNVDSWQNIRVVGRHGLTLHGTWPLVGVLASDVIAYALARWAPLLKFTTGTYGSIKPTSFLIPHLVFKEAGPISDWLPQVNKFELKEWGVWNQQTFYLNDRGAREGRKRWRARVRPTQLKETGKQIDRVWNGVVVQWQDVGGKTLAVAPPGSGYTRTDSRLLDLDPENPANQIPGEKRWAKIALKSMSTLEGAIRTGEKFIELSKLLDGSGQAIFDGLIEDETGALFPYHAAHAGDLVDFRDSSFPGDRYMIRAARKRSERKAEITLDAPPDQMEALLEELDIVLTGSV